MLGGSPEQDDKGIDEERRRIESEVGAHAEMRDDDAANARTHCAGDVDVDGVELDGSGHVVARDEFRYERLVRGRNEHRTRADHEGEHQEECGRHVTSDCERRQQCSGHRQGNLNRDDESPPIEDIGEHASHDGEEDVREHVGGLDQRDEDGGVRGVYEKPLGAHCLHPRTDVADQ